VPLRFLVNDAPGVRVSGLRMFHPKDVDCTTPDRCTALLVNRHGLDVPRRAVVSPVDSGCEIVDRGFRHRVMLLAVGLPFEA